MYRRLFHGTRPLRATLAALVLVLLAACGGTAPNTTSDSPAATSAAGASAPTSGTQSDGQASGAPVTLRVVGFEVTPEEKGTPLDQAYQKFLNDFRESHPNVTLESLETPPEFDKQLLVDLAAGTAPDIWQQDASTLARLVDGGYVTDMRECQQLVPTFDFERFFPSVLDIHRRPDGAVYGVPNDFTSMVIFYNPQAYEKAGVEPPTSDWTWDDYVETAKQLTLDNQGRNRNDPGFDESNVVQWGTRARKFTFEWVYRVWENGGDVIAPDGSTASGYLDSPQTIEALKWHQDLVLVHKVAPPPSTLDQMTQSLGFNDRFLKGEFAMFDRGHWEIFGLTNNKEYQEGSVAVVGQPQKENDATVIYASGWVIRNGVEGDQLQAACEFVDAATSREYQDTKNITGIAIAANQAAAEDASTSGKYPELTSVFAEEVANGRPPYGSKFAKYPTIEEILDSMMERILAGGNVEEEAARTVEEINRELSSQ